MKTNLTQSLTLNNVTWEQMEAIKNLLATDGEETTTTKKTGKKAKPGKTVSEDEEEDFATKEMSEEEIDEDSDEDTDESEEDEDGEEEQELSWTDLKDAVNTYGNKKPEDMKAILLSFNFKSTKELKMNPKKWEAVYRKVQSKMKTIKGKK